MELSAVWSMEQNRLIEWRGSRKDPDDWAGYGVNDESRDHSGPVVVKVEAEKKLSLPGETGSRAKGFMSESGSG
jgi:hypothetical protein